jgi:tetratricopeptide (TPR) repeat protein
MAKATRSLNTKLLVLMLGTAVAVLVGIVVVHRIQVRRNAVGLANIARVMRDNGRLSESIGYFARYLQYRPNDAVAHAEFARLCLEQAEKPEASPGHRQLAYDAVDAAVRRNPDDLELRKRLAEVMLRFARFADAAREAGIILERLDAAVGDAADGVDRDEVRLLRAQGLAGSGRYPEAAAAAAEVIGFDMDTKTYSGSKEPGPSTLGASMVLADMLARRLKEPETAARVLEQAAVLCEDDYRAWVALASWQRDTGRLKEANESVARAARLAPDERDVLFAAIDLAVVADRFAEAESLAERVREKYPEDERAYRAIALALVRQGKNDAALALLRQALKDRADIRIDPTTLLLMVGDLELQRQNFTAVENTIAECVSLMGNSEPSVGLLEARMLIARQKWLPATRKLEAVRPLVASSEQMTKQVDLLLGQCHERLGQYDEQLAANRRVLSEEYDSLIARIGTAEALIGSGKGDEALTELETIAAGLPAAEIAGLPQVWRPLLRLRAAAQSRRAPTEQDWTLVEQLMDDLEQSPLVSASEINMVMADTFARRGKTAEAVALLRREVGVNPTHTEAWGALAMLAMQSQGGDAARAVLAEMPPESADSPLILVIAAQLAAGGPADDRTAVFTRLEERAASSPDVEAGRMLGSLAMIRRTLGEAAEAERLLLAARKHVSDDLKIVLALFELACERGDVEAAESRAAEIARLAGETTATGRVAIAAAKVLDVRVRRAERVRRLQANDGAIELDDEERQRLADANVQLILAENDRPGWAQIQQLFAEVAGLRGDMVEAIDRLQQAVAMNGGSPAVIRQLVGLLYSSNRMAEAQELLARLGSQGEARGLERLSAELELGIGQFDVAVAIAERSLDESTDLSISDLLWFGQVLARAGKRDEAAEVFERAIARDPARSEPWLALFATQLGAGWKNRAEKTLRNAEAGLESPTRELVRAQCQEMTGDYDAAEKSFRDAVAAAPGKVVVTRGLASFLLRRGRLEAARRELEAMAAATTDDAATKSARIWARRTLAGIVAAPGGYRDVARGVELVEKNLSSEGRASAEDLALVVSLLAPRPETDNWRRALKAIDQLAAIQPLSTAQLLEKIRLLEQTGDWEECRHELLTLVSAPNALSEHLALLVTKLVRHGDLDTAATWLEKLREREPASASTLILETRLALARNDRSTAVAVARRLLPGSLPADELDRNLGSIAPLMEELGFRKAADSLYDRWRGLSPQGLLERAEFLGRAHRMDEALDLLEEYFDRIPPERILRSGLAVLHSQGTAVAPADIERVDRWFSKCLRADPDGVGIAVLLADLRSLQGRVEDVKSIYTAILGREDVPATQRAIVANNLAFLLARPETAGQAREFVEMAIEQLGPHPDVLDTRGLVRLAAGEAGAAVSDLTEAVLDRSATKYLHLACALAADQRMDSARKALAEARRQGLDATRLATEDAAMLRSLEAAMGS